MANLRILFQDVVKTASISATSAVLPVANLQTDIKSDVWRSSTKTETITLTWTATQTLNMVALPFCGLTSSATIQVKCYTNSTDSTAAYDSGAKIAAPGSSNTNLGSSMYAFGGGTYGYIYFPSIGCKKLTVTISDTSNSLGYIEAARLLTGSYYEFVINPEYNIGQSGNITITQNENTTFERSDAGDQRIDRGSIFRTLNLALPWMEQADRNFVWSMLRNNGMYSPIFVSTCPASTDANEEIIYCLYGRITKPTAMQYYFMNQFSATLEVEEI